MQSSLQAVPAKSGVTAKVKWFNPAKGFGFVAPNDGSADAFLHVSVVQRAGLRTLRQGATIICDLTDGPRGPQVALKIGRASCREREEVEEAAEALSRIERPTVK